MLQRLFKHLTTTQLQLRKLFPAPVLAAITTAIAAAEQQHGGEIVVAIEASLPMRQVAKKQSPRERAIEVFARLQVWDTMARNGVLIYFCVADRAVEIVADRGFAQHVTVLEWQQICQDIVKHIQADHAEPAVLQAIGAVSELIAKHFPMADRNERPDQPVLL